MVTGWHGNFPGLSNTTNQLVKNSVNGMCTLYNANFPRKSKTKNETVKISFSGTQGATLFPKERAGLKINQSNLALTIRRVECYFPKKE